MKSAVYYAVKVGRRAGIYAQWDEAKAQVEKFPGAIHKKFKSLNEAKEYLGEAAVPATTVNNIEEVSIGNIEAKPKASRAVSATRAPSPLLTTPSIPSNTLSFMNAFWPASLSDVHYPSLDIEIYTDGSCLGNNNVSVNKCPAGWGFLAVPLTDASSGPIRVLTEMYGPVVLDKDSPFYLGATVGSNNTGELTAMVEAFHWLTALEKHFGNSATAERKAGRVIIRGDSTYAMKSISGEYNGAKNKELIATARDVLLRLEALRRLRGAPAVQFQHVKGHSADVFNDRADVLANFGSAGKQCSTGRYYSEMRHNSNNATDSNSCSKRPRTE